jgi:hypothetical protein
MAYYPAKIPPRVALLHLSGREYDVLVAIALHANRDGFAWPSLATIVAEAGTREKRVPGHIHKLEETRILLTRRGGGRGRRNVYRIIPDNEFRNERRRANDLKREPHCCSSGVLRKPHPTH